ncbi:MAG TPA: proton-conducting transporter membrane subunit [Verrucomicrobiota bacterium]|nr:hypothetical protein [Verrucomicrobiales bacterium]HRI11861.1 proton-conducting transporter membrane subunit [Verrucomicrobiota bacterium]
MNVVIFPVLVPLLTAVVLILWRQPSGGRRLSAAASAAAQLGIALALVTQLAHGGWRILPVGNWAPPFGIVLSIDLLAALMLALSGLTSLACLVYGFFELPVRLEHPLRLPLVQFLVTGINLAFVTGDLFNLFVAFEVMLISSYALLTLEADNWDIKQAFPYIAVNLVGSALFLCAAGLIYALTGTLNYAHLAAVTATQSSDPRLLAVLLLLLVVFALKAGVFPLYHWLPNSYPTLPIPVAALYAGMLTKVGIYVLFRMLTTVFPHDLDFIHRLLAWLAALTMLLGVLGAISRNFIRGILSFHILSQVGFMVLAIGLFTPISLAAAVLYIIHHIVVKSSLFLVGGIVTVLNRTDDLDHTGNLWRKTPWVGLLFLAQAMSLSGLPPLSGFWGKYLIVVAGLELEDYFLVGISLVASVLTLFSMLKIWLAVFWREDEKVLVNDRDPRWHPMTAVVTVLTVISLGLGIGVEGVLRLAHQAAATALDQAGYIEAVQQTVQEIGAKGIGG